MELESHFFNDSIFDIEKQDYWVLERSYVYQQEGVHTGWYKPYVEKLIKKDPKKYKYFLQQNGFMDEKGSINWPTYSVNGLGFRSDDWRSGKNGVIFLGCSDTFGVGNYLENTAASIVSKELGLRNYNLAVPGGGLDQAYRVLKTHIADIQGNMVFLIVPEPTRREIFTEHTSVPLSPSSWSNGLTKQNLKDFYDIKTLEEFYFKLMCEKKYTFIETQKNIDAIKYLCKEYHKHFILLKNPVIYEDKSSRVIRKKSRIDIPLKALKVAKGNIRDLACDLLHPGPHFQKLLAKNLLKKL